MPRGQLPASRTIGATSSAAASAVRSRKDKAHFFVAVERTKQDTLQAVNTGGLFPDKDGVVPDRIRENLVTGKVTRNLNAHQFCRCRYGHNSNSQPYGTSAINPPKTGATATTASTRSISITTGCCAGRTLNEFIFQYADFRNQITSASSAPNESFPNGVTLGANSNTPQTTEQHKFQFRDDFSWHVYRGGLGHDFKVGVNFINEPHLFTTFNGGRRDRVYTHPTNDLERADFLRVVQRRRRGREPADEAVRAVHPGRLAPQRQADPESRAPLRRHDRHTRSTSRESELRRPAGGRQKRAPERPDWVRGFRQGSPGGLQQHPAAARTGVRCPRPGPRRRPRVVGHLHRRRLHELEHPDRRRGREPARFWSDVRRLEPERPPESRRQLLQGRSAADQHREPERGAAGQQAAVRVRGRSRRARAAGIASSPSSAGRIRSMARRSSTPTTCTSTAGN